MIRAMLYLIQPPFEVQKMKLGLEKGASQRRRDMETKINEEKISVVIIQEPSYFICNNLSRC